MSIYDLTMASITGEQVSLGTFAGKYNLIVTVASR